MRDWQWYWDQIWTSPPFAFMAIVVMIALAFLFIYIFVRIADWGIQRYRRRLYRLANRIAQEFPEFLAQATEDLPELAAPANSTDVAIFQHRRPRMRSVETIPRAELEQYAHALEGYIVEQTTQIAQGVDEAREFREKYEWAITWKQRHWARIKRMIFALDNDDDVWAAAHPRLARERG